MLFSIMLTAVIQIEKIFGDLTLLNIS
jgi:hypothetical protein